MSGKKRKNKKRNKKRKNISHENIHIDNDNYNSDDNIEKEYTNQDNIKESYNTINIENKSFKEEPKIEDIFMHTARNKWKNKEKENTENNLPHILEINDNLTIYKYSNTERISPDNLIYQYFYDKFEGKDYENAYIIIFIGKTGDGKTTAINAFFNIIKGIKLEDNYRYILVEEQKKEKGQAESQTDGVHLYYIKDYNNKPIIIIDSQGFGDTRGKQFDELVNKAFEYTFSKLIDHINTICFIAKASEARLDNLINYIFSCATSLFSDDLSRNFIILSTFANRSTIKEGPLFISSIKNNEIFKYICDKMDEKFWYAADSKTIFENDIEDKLTKYSFKNLNDLYEEKVINSKPKDINKSYQIISCRNQIKDNIKNIILYYINLLSEKEKLSYIESNINSYENKINDINNKINNKEYEIRQIYIPNIDYEREILKKEHDKKIYDLDNQYENVKYVRFKDVGGERTICYKCERNCHDPCDCFGGFVFRCKVFPIFGNSCEVCGHSKSDHGINRHYKFVEETEKRKIYNTKQIFEEKDFYRKKLFEITNNYYKKTQEKSRSQFELEELNFEKKNYIEEKSFYINRKEKINDNIKLINKDIILKILDLINIHHKIENIAMNKIHIKIENSYIDSCIYQIENGGDDKNGNKVKLLKEYQNYNEFFNTIKEIKEDELISFGLDYYLDKYKKLLLKFIH